MLRALRKVYAQGTLRPRAKELGDSKESLPRKTDNPSECYRKQREGIPGKGTEKPNHGGGNLQYGFFQDFQGNGNVKAGAGGHWQEIELGCLQGHIVQVYLGGNRFCRISA